MTTYVSLSNLANNDDNKKKEADNMATIYLRDFPEDLHHKAKIRAAIERGTLKDVFVKALKWYLLEAEALDMASDPEEEGMSSLPVSRKDLIELFGTDDIAEIKGMVREHAKLLVQSRKAPKSAIAAKADRKVG